ATEDNELDRPIRVAFKKAGHDEANPIHWHILLRLLARAHFGPKRKQGAPPQWPSARYCQLLYDAHQIEKNPKFRDADVYKVLQKNPSYRRWGRPLSVETLRRELRYAAQPKHNKILRASEKSEIARLKDLHQKSGREW